jgi:hypothetical protein
MLHFMLLLTLQHYPTFKMNVLYLLGCLSFCCFLNKLQALFIITLQMLSKIHDETQKTLGESGGMGASG